MPPFVLVRISVLCRGAALLYPDPGTVCPMSARSIFLKRVSAASAKSPTRKSTASRKPRSLRTPGRRAHNGSRLRRHEVQVAHKHRRIKGGSISAALIPRRRLRVDSLKRLAPVLLYSQRHRERQKFLEHLRRLDHAVEAIGFHVLQKVLKSQHA